MFSNVWRTAMFVCTLATYAVLDGTPGRSEKALDVSLTQEKRTFDCAVRTSIGTPLVIGGMSAKRGEVPWHAGLYRKSTTPYEQMCGGSVISTTIVLSAAHCFWDDQERKQHPADQFAVAVGKLYRPWNDPHDEAQKSDVKEVYVPDHYQGSWANYQADLAVVVVVTPFQFTAHVQPVCLDFDVHHSGNMGKVAGWGLTSIDGNPSETLNVLDIPYVDVKTCISGSPLEFRGHITSNKFCAGFKDNSTALCKGDSGGGLAFPRTARGAVRFYLRGVVSTAPRPNNDALCNTNAYTTFTHLLPYQHFISTYWDAATYQQPRYEKTGWDWSRCREETVPNNRRITSEQLHPLSAAEGGGGRLRLAYRGDGYMYIYLSREARVDTSRGLYFYIDIWRTDALFSVVDAGVLTSVQRVIVGTNLSSSHWTKVVLDVGAGSLEVRVGDAATPLLAGRDPRLAQMQYIGFDTCFNPGGHATFKYEC